VHKFSVGVNFELSCELCIYTDVQFRYAIQTMSYTIKSKDKIEFIWLIKNKKVY